MKNNLNIEINPSFGLSTEVVHDGTGKVHFLEYKETIQRIYSGNSPGYKMEFTLSAYPINRQNQLNLKLNTNKSTFFVPLLHINFG